MASINDIALLKKHLYIDHSEDDEYLGHLYDAATTSVERYIEHPLADYNPMPPTLLHAILLLAGHWYNVREGVGVKMDEVPYGIAWLILPYKKYNTNASGTA